MSIDFELAPWVGHLPYLLLVAALSLNSILWIRLLVGAAAVSGLFVSLVWLHSPTGLFWNAALLAVVLIRVALAWSRSRDPQFNVEERDFLRQFMPNLPLSEARRLLSMGVWVSGKPGTTLTVEGEPVLFLICLTEGSACIETGGKRIGTCSAGSFIGEMSLLENTIASASATLDTPARYWMIPSIRMRDLRRDDPALWESFQSSLSQDLGRKVRRMNQSATA